ncbi:MAG: hypothetical protein M0R03_20710 [Novosphingobium sp.]|nr:hypothetical protein [Novosphingobium sp.]
MSSHIDYFDCPQCGGNAQREQDNRSGEVFFSCSNCSWNGGEVEKTDIVFKCPNCKVEGNSYIECVLDGIHHQTVSIIEADDCVIYNNLESEAEVDRYQCEHCGYILRDKDNYNIDNEEDLILWLRRNK